MGIVERKQRQKEEVRCAILDAAWKLVVSEGWQSLSMRKIAEAIEYSAPVIYDHFQNKEAILMEFTRRGFHLLDTDLREAKEKSSDPAVQLHDMGYAYWNFAFSNPRYYQLMYGLGMPSCETVKKIEELHSFTKTLSSSINALIGRSDNKDLNPFLKLHTFWSMLHGLISINMMDDKRADDLNKMILDDFISSFIRSIGK